MLRNIALYLFLIFNFTPVVASQGPERQDPSYVSIRASRLVSNAEHTNFLRETLATATNTALISTHKISPNRLFGEEGIGYDIVNAHSQGVAIYIYYKELVGFSEQDYAALRTLASYCVKFEQNANHSKCVARDRDTVAIGSYEWLSDPWNGSSNGSMVITGGLASGLIDDVWQGIRFYQSLEYGNVRGQIKFLSDRDAFSMGTYQYALGDFFYTLRTPEAHGIFFNEALEKAKGRVFVFSPFIRLQKLRATLTTQVLSNLHQRGVTFTLITLPSPCNHVPQEQKAIFSDLDSLCGRFTNFSYLVHPNFHAKSIVADDDLICEGSFNPFSAVTQIDHEANNFEMSVALRGKIAQELIRSFESTDLGKFVLTNYRSKPSFPLKIDQRSGFTATQPLRQHIKRPRDGTDIQDQPPFKKGRIETTQVPSSFDSDIRIFSGKRFGIQGYCVRLNDGDYLRNRVEKTLYFKTPEMARQAAYAFWK